MKKKIYYIVLAGMVACSTVFSVMPSMSPVQSTQADSTESALYEKIDDQADKIAKLQESIDELTRQKQEENKEKETEEKKEETADTQSTPATAEQEKWDNGNSTQEEKQEKTETNTVPTVANSSKQTQTQQQTSAIVSVPAELPKDADKERELVEKINEQAKAIQDQSDTINNQSEAIKQANQNIEDLKNKLTEVQATQKEQQNSNIEIPTGTEINAERVNRFFNELSDIPDAPLSTQPTTCDKFLDGLTDAEREAYHSFEFAVRTGNSDGTYLDLGQYNPYTEFRPDAFRYAVNYTIFRYVHCSYTLFHGTPQADGSMNWYIFINSDLHRAWLANQQQAKVVQAVADKIVTPGITEKGAVLRFQDWISTHLTYLTDNYNPGTSIYLSYGNCQSYAQLFAEMCNHVGIPCYCVEGDAIPEDKWLATNHIWNCACVGGEWYYFDLCWSDNDEENDPYNLDYMFSKEPFSGREIIDFTSPYFDYGS